MNEKLEKDRRPTIASFDDFLIRLDLAVKSATEKRNPSAVLSFLRRKTSFNFTQEQAELTRRRLQILPNFETLEFSVFIESCLNSRPSRAVSAVGAEVGKEYRAHTKFVDYCANETRHSGLSPCIRGWVAHLKESAGPQTVPPSTPWPPPKIVRAAFGCLLSRREADDFLEATLLFLRSFFPLASKNPSKSAPQQISAKFLQSVVGLLKPKTPRKGHIQLILLTAAALEESVQQAKSNLNKLRLDSESLKEDLAARTEEISGLREEAINSQKMISDLQAKLAQSDAMVSQEKAKNEALDKHWKVILQQELAGLSARLRRQLEHEVSEIHLCLAGDSPNLEMASHRIARVAEIIAGLKGE